jgi:hypothetical protein
VPDQESSLSPDNDVQGPCHPAVRCADQKLCPLACQLAGNREGNVRYGIADAAVAALAVTGLPVPPSNPPTHEALTRPAGGESDD